MELNSKNNSRRDSMIPSKSFDTREVREISWKEAGESRDFPILWMRCLFRKERNGMQSPGKIKDVKKKIHARARKLL